MYIQGYHMRMTGKPFNKSQAWLQYLLSKEQGNKRNKSSCRNIIWYCLQYLLSNPYYESCLNLSHKCWLKRNHSILTLSISEPVHEKIHPLSHKTQLQAKFHCPSSLPWVHALQWPIFDLEFMTDDAADLL